MFLPRLSLLDKALISFLYHAKVLHITPAHHTTRTCPRQPLFQRFPRAASFGKSRCNGAESGRKWRLLTCPLIHVPLLLLLPPTVILLQPLKYITTEMMLRPRLLPLPVGRCCKLWPFYLLVAFLLQFTQFLVMRLLHA